MILWKLNAGSQILELFQNREKKQDNNIRPFVEECINRKLKVEILIKAKETERNWHIYDSGFNTSRIRAEESDIQVF